LVWFSVIPSWLMLPFVPMISQDMYRLHLKQILITNHPSFAKVYMTWIDIYWQSYTINIRKSWSYCQFNFHTPANSKVVQSEDDEDKERSISKSRFRRQKMKFLEKITTTTSRHRHNQETGRTCTNVDTLATFCLKLLSRIGRTHETPTPTSGVCVCACARVCVM